MDVDINYNKTEEEFINANRQIMNKIIEKAMLTACRDFVTSPEIKKHFSDPSFSDLLRSRINIQLAKL
jgi:hypothetical protein